MFRFNLKDAEISYNLDCPFGIIEVKGGVILKHYVFWEIIYPKNLPFWTAWKLKRSILWEVKRREKKKRRNKKTLILSESFKRK